MPNTPESQKFEEAGRQKRRRRLGEMLIEAGLLSQIQLGRALEESEKAGTRLGEALINHSLVSEYDLARYLSNQLGFTFVDLGKESLGSDLSLIVPEPIARRFQAVPLRLEGKSLTVAMLDPLDFEAIRDLSFLSGYALKPVIGTRSGIKQALDKIYPKRDIETPIVRIASDSTEEYDQHLLQTLSDIDRPMEADAQALEEATRRAPIVRLSNMLMTEAVRSRASDIHIEPGRKDTTVRYRIDGLLREVTRLAKSTHAPLISRIKVLSNLDIAERRLPQDGSVRVNIEGREVDLRVSTMPTQYGEKMVLRITDQSKSTLRLDTIGLSEKDYTAIKSFTHRQKGILLVTGPTGSGKTTTLYGLINSLKSPSLNLITVEDPIETSIEGINQTQINPDAGLTFAGALRSILRQDPDVILVGEIRDHETAEVAVRAAMTGHLVLSTLHTTDAPSAITRLINLGIPRHLVASLVEGVIAQRLVRTICPKCKADATPSQAALLMLKIQPETLAHVRFYAGKGCTDCGGTGYWGRTAIMEILDPTARLRELIASEATEQDVRLAALADKMTSLGEDGLNKAKAGVTTLEELLRVIEVTSKIESICPTCARIVQYDFQACPYCESPLIRTCDACRRPLQLEWKLCPYCGGRAGEK